MYTHSVPRRAEIRPGGFNASRISIWFGLHEVVLLLRRLFIVEILPFKLIFLEAVRV